jgi:hypothetical protein
VLEDERERGSEGEMRGKNAKKVEKTNKKSEIDFLILNQN